eukprot:476319-Prorocentrum_minimum.AAC.1
MVDVKGFGVDVKGYTVVVKGYMVDAKGCTVTVKGYRVDAKGYTVVFKGTWWMLRATRWTLRAIQGVLLRDGQVHGKGALRVPAGEPHPAAAGAGFSALRLLHGAAVERQPGGEHGQPQGEVLLLRL